MYCSSCGSKNDDDAKFCDHCGADLSLMPRAPGTAPAQAPRPAPNPPAPMYYPPARTRAWWYPIGVWVILAAFFVFIDVATTGRITWSVWPVGILGIFMLGFPLLHRLEEWSSRPRRPV